MNLLAMAAALLLLLVPTVGRLMEAAPARRDCMCAEMCAAAGLPWTQHAQAPGSQPDPHAVHHAKRPSGVDCAYCPLLAALLVIAVSVWLACLRTPALRRAPRRASLPARWQHPCGLGSRGPPAIA